MIFDKRFIFSKSLYHRFLQFYLNFHLNLCTTSLNESRIKFLTPILCGVISEWSRSWVQISVNRGPDLRFIDEANLSLYNWRQISSRQISDCFMANNCCEFRPAFECTLVELIFFSHFQPFFFISNLFQCFHGWNQQKTSEKKSTEKRQFWGTPLF